MVIGINNLQSSFSNPTGYEFLGGLKPLNIPIPQFSKDELYTEQARFRMALENQEPFFLPLDKAVKQEGQMEFPLDSMPLYIPLQNYHSELNKVLGETDFINPFLGLMLSRWEQIGSRKYPTDIAVSNLSGHYLPMSIAGAMLSRKNVSECRIGDNQANSIRFNAILGLFHDGPEDYLFSLDEIKGIRSKDTNGQLFKSINALTRNGTGDGVPLLDKRMIYAEYGEHVGGDINVARMKWLDITASCLQDLLNGVPRTTEDNYIVKQGIVLDAMGKALKKRAAQLLSSNTQLQSVSV